MRKILLSTLLAFILPLTIGCGSSDNFSGTTVINNTTNTGPNLSGLTGQVTLETQLAPTAQVLSQEVLIFKSPVIPASVTDLRFTGVDANGAFIYGPVVKSKAQTIVLEDVPVEVVSLRIELLADGFTVGGLVTPIAVVDGQTTVLNDPNYIFPGGSNPSEVYGSFVSRIGENQPGEFGIPPEGGFPASEAPVYDFPTSLVTNGVTRVSPGNYTVSESGDYLLTYGIETFSDSFVLVQLVRDGVYVPNTEIDLTALSFFLDRKISAQFNFGESSPLQGFQYIVTLQAGDEVSLRVVDFDFEGLNREVRAQQTDNPVFEMVQGTFSITRLGEGGVTGPTVVPPLQDG